MNQRQLHPTTIAIRTQTEQTAAEEHSTTTLLTNSFTFETAENMRAAFADETEDNIYSLYSKNPTVNEFVSKMVLLEKCEAGLLLPVVWQPFSPPSWR